MATFRAARSGYSIYPVADVTIDVPFLQADGTWAIPNATVTVASGNPVTVEIQDIHQLPKVSTDVFTVGSTLYWDASVGKLTITPTGNSPIGISVLACANPSSVGQVNLNAAPHKSVGYSKIKLVPLLTIPAGTKPSNTLAVGTEWNGAVCICTDIGATPGTPDATVANLSGVVSAGNLVVKSAVNATADAKIAVLLVL